MHPFQIQFALQRKKHITFKNLVFSLKKNQINVHPKLFEDKNTLLPDLLDQFYFTQGNTLSYHYIQVRVNSMGWRVNHLSFSPFQEVSNSSNLTNIFNVFLSSLYARQFHMNKSRDTSRKQSWTSLCLQIHWLAAGTCSSSTACMPSFPMK